MKYENYLYVMNDNGVMTYKLARGYRLEEDSRLAYAKTIDPSQYSYMIIDVASGLFVIKATSKKKLFQLWNEKTSNPEFINAIIKARKTDSYLKRIEEINPEKKLWRESGYSIEGRGFEL